MNDKKKKGPDEINDCLPTTRYFPMSTSAAERVNGKKLIGPSVILHLAPSFFQYQSSNVPLPLETTNPSPDRASHPNFQVRAYPCPFLLSS